MKKSLKRLLGDWPLAPELYWQLRSQGRPLSKSFSLQLTKKHLPGWIEAAQRANEQRAVSGQLPEASVQESVGAPADGSCRRIFIFTTLRYWIEHGVLLSLALAGSGHQVTFSYLPYNNFQKPMSRFDLRRQNAYAASVFEPARELILPLSLLDVKTKEALPGDLLKAIQKVSLRDAQYVLQVEQVDVNSDLYRLRLERNTQAAQAALAWLSAHRPDVILTPNGSILEMGAIYQVARQLSIPIVTYEFGEQRGRIWLANNDEVMLQNTHEMWAARKHRPLDDGQRSQIEALYASRRGASLWENFSRRWQGLPSQGGEQVRGLLGLDNRPVVLLAANVIGDSLTLGRQVFSRDMTEWLQETMNAFAARPDVQLVVRIHPGERYTKGPSVADVIREGMPTLPENIHMVAASDPVNTYDLVDIADLGLVYTTTVGMEMAMSGVPVIVAGQTHYRGKGFTIDPTSWENYTSLLNHALGAGLQTPPARGQVELAWQYAYQFFFDYPMNFPWHMLYFGEELAEWPLEKVLSPEGQARYFDVFQALAGAPRRWMPVKNTGPAPRPTSIPDDLAAGVNGLEVHQGLEAQASMMQFQANEF